MVSKNTINIILILPLAATLFNSEMLGPITLVALLLYTIFASIAAAVLFSSTLAGSQSYLYRPKPYASVLLALVLYIFVHGLLTSTVSIVHYYWLTNGLYFTSVNFWSCSKPINGTGSAKTTLAPYTDKTIPLYMGISVLVLAESLLVILQYIHLLPSMNEFFPASGTWVNPNITAMFIALGIFAVLQVKGNVTSPLRKVLVRAVLFIALAAVLLLKCRSAYLAVVILLLAEYAPAVKKIRFNIRTMVSGLVVLLLAGFVAAVFVSKKKSAFNRVKIWENTFELASSGPPAGYGFGRFEKEYNVFAAQQMNKENDHINMPYNDFLELWTEGGIPAVVLWTAIILLTFRYFFILRHRRSQSVILAFIVIQMINFGFQAIPVTALFLFYMAMGENAEQKAESKSLNEESNAGWSSNRTGYSLTVFAAILLLVSLGLLYKAVNLTGLLYRNEAARKAAQTQPVVGIYRQLASGLDGNNLFHENYGDALIQEKDFEAAKKQFLRALTGSSREGLFAKIGYCFQQMEKYDSSEYYYRILENMTPHKFNPKFWSLKLYEQKMDSVMLYRKAREIINMPVKVDGERVQFIKNYASQILDSLNISKK
jgi:O-antigen polymerase